MNLLKKLFLQALTCIVLMHSGCALSAASSSRTVVAPASRSIFANKKTLWFTLGAVAISAALITALVYYKKKNIVKKTKPEDTPDVASVQDIAKQIPIPSTMPDAHPNSRSPVYKAVVCQLPNKQNQIQEDCYTTKENYFGVFDGCGGDTIARYLANTLLTTADSVLKDAALKNKSTQEIVNTIEMAWEEITNSKQISGLTTQRSTAITVQIIGSTIYTSNVGNSRAVLCSAGTAQSLSNDHVATMCPARYNNCSHESTCTRTHSIAHKYCPRTKDLACYDSHRATLAGAKIEHFIVLEKKDGSLTPIEKKYKKVDDLTNCFFRVNRRFKTTRFVGFLDKHDKENEKDLGIISTPEITTHTITPKDQFIILASDGLWDALSNDEAVEHVLKSVAGGETLDKVAHSLAQTARNKKCINGQSNIDDITVMIVDLRS